MSQERAECRPGGNSEVVIPVKKGSDTVGEPLRVANRTHSPASFDSDKTGELREETEALNYLNGFANSIGSLVWRLDCREKQVRGSR